MGVLPRGRALCRVEDESAEPDTQSLCSTTTYGKGMADASLTHDRSTLIISGGSMRNRLFATAALALLAPTAAFAASAATPTSHGSAAAFTAPVSIAPSGDFTADRDDPKCGRGKAWGCRRDRDDSRYDDRWDDDRRDRDRYEHERYDRDRYEHERYERASYERERWERERYARERYERERELKRYRHRDRRYERYDRHPTACIQAGGRVIGSAVLTICIP